MNVITDEYFVNLIEENLQSEMSIDKIVLKIITIYLYIYVYKYIYIYIYIYIDTVNNFHL